MAFNNQLQKRGGRKQATRRPQFHVTSNHLVPKYFNTYQPFSYPPPPPNQSPYVNPFASLPYYFNPYVKPYLGPHPQPHPFYQPELSPQWVQMVLNPMHFPGPPFLPPSYQIFNKPPDDYWETLPHIREVTPPDTPPVHKAVGVQVNRENTREDIVRGKVETETSKLLDELLFEQLVDEVKRNVDEEEEERKRMEKERAINDAIETVTQKILNGNAQHT